MHNVIQLCLAANNILLMRYVLMWKKADRFASRRYSLEKKLGDRMIKQLLNSVITKYRDLPVSRTSIICLSLWLRQIIDVLTTDKSRYFAQPRPITVNYCFLFQVFRLWWTAQRNVSRKNSEGLEWGVRAKEGSLLSLTPPHHFFPLFDFAPHHLNAEKATVTCSSVTL